MEGELMIQSRPPQFTTIKCPHCSAMLEFTTPEKTGPEKVHIKCHVFSCSGVIVFNVKTSSIDSSTPNAGASSKKYAYKIGSDEKPLSMEYYEVLGIPHTATTAEIKKKYYALAMQYHPDKNQTPEAEEKFKKISEVYQVLSDPALRTKYNEFGPGKGSNPEGGFMNPEEFFKQQFGGELFSDIIGELSLARDFKSVMVRSMGKEGEEENESDSKDLAKSAEKRKEEAELRKKVRDERVGVLAENLIRKLSLYTNGNGPENEQHFRNTIEEEANELKVQNFGIPLLQSIGYIYSAKANEYLSKEEFLGISSFFQQMRLKGRAINNTFSTVKSAVDVHKSFSQLQEAEKKGVSQEERDKMEHEAARKGINVLWKGSKLEVEGVLRNVCDKVLGNHAVDKELLKKRALGLKIIGEIYQKVTKDIQFDFDQTL